jgi:regulator of sirC expression with transglutaminase-like and TPR domain
VDPTDRFADLVRGPEDVLGRHLDEAALLIAAHARPELDVEAYRGRLDELAARCEEATVADVTHLLFEVEGFRGNDRDYYDPRNSHLDQVIDRRLGIPITLAVVLLEVGRRLALPLAGVSMPGHFLVRVGGDPVVLIDPFERGRLLSRSECQERFAAVHGPAAPWDPSFLDPVGPRAIIARMLANLRGVHLQHQESVALERVLRLRALLPGASLDDRAERAGVLAALARFGEAADLLEDLSDEAPDPRAAALTSQARRLRARLN